MELVCKNKTASVYLSLPIFVCDYRTRKFGQKRKLMLPWWRFKEGPSTNSINILQINFKYISLCFVLSKIKKTQSNNTNLTPIFRELLNHPSYIRMKLIFCTIYSFLNIESHVFCTFIEIYPDVVLHKFNINN